MRIVIKDADFSAVSIGKVYRDLSFNYPNTASLKADFPWANVISRTAALSWNQSSGNLSNTTFLGASSGDNAYTPYTNNNARLVSDYLEVCPGMVIHFNHFINTATIPVIVCYDENKTPLGPSASYSKWVTSTSADDTSFTVPDGVKYITFCVTSLDDFSGGSNYIRGEMPE